MIIILLTVLFFILGFICFKQPDYKYENCGIASYVIACTLAIIVLGTAALSFNSYVGMRAFFDKTEENYTQAIAIYKAELRESDVNSAWVVTDLINQGYQTGLHDFINDYRDKVIRYNRTFIGKKKYADNIFFSWFIIEPDEACKYFMAATISDQAPKTFNSKISRHTSTLAASKSSWGITFVTPALLIKTSSFPYFSIISFTNFSAVPGNAKLPCK